MLPTRMGRDMLKGDYHPRHDSGATVQGADLSQGC